MVFLLDESHEFLARALIEDGAPPPCKVCKVFKVDTLSSDLCRLDEVWNLAIWSTELNQTSFLRRVLSSFAGGLAA
jgi:hypothetical protein